MNASPQKMIVLCAFFLLAALVGNAFGNESNESNEPDDVFQYDEARYPDGAQYESPDFLPTPPTPLYKAIESGNLEEVQKLIAAGEDVNELYAVKWEDDSTLEYHYTHYSYVHKAIQMHRADIAKALLDAGAHKFWNLPSCGGYFWTNCSYVEQAIEQGDWALFQLFVDYGLLKTRKGTTGTSPGKCLQSIGGHWEHHHRLGKTAKEKIFHDMFFYALEHVTDPEEIANLPVITSSPEFCKATLEKGADPNRGWVWRNRIPLKEYLRRGDEDSLAVVETLLAGGADPNLDNDASTANCFIPDNSDFYVFPNDQKPVPFATVCSVLEYRKNLTFEENCAVRLRKLQLLHRYGLDYSTLSPDMHRLLLRRMVILGDTESLRAMVAAGFPLNADDEQPNPMLLAGRYTNEKTVVKMCQFLYENGFTNLDKYQEKYISSQFPPRKCIIPWMVRVKLPTEEQCQFLACKYWEDAEIMAAILETHPDICLNEMLVGEFSPFRIKKLDDKASRPDEMQELIPLMRRILRPLIESGNIDLTTLQNGRVFCQWWKYPDVTRCLLELGVNPNCRGDFPQQPNDPYEVLAGTPCWKGVSALHLTALFPWIDEKTRVQAAQMFLEAGADVNLPDAENHTPLDYAVRWNHPQLAALFQKNGGKESPAK